jgi:hypothetical protein
MSIAAVTSDEMREIQKEIPTIPHAELMWLAAFFAAIDRQEFHDARKVYKEMHH